MLKRNYGALSFLFFALWANLMGNFSHFIKKPSDCHFTDSICAEDPHHSEGDGGRDKSVRLIGSEMTGFLGTLKPDHS